MRPWALMAGRVNSPEMCEGTQVCRGVKFQVTQNLDFTKSTKYNPIFMYPIYLHIPYLHVPCLVPFHAPRKACWEAAAPQPISTWTEKEADIFSSCRSMGDGALDSHTVQESSLVYA